jgi:hypothetical protein
MVNAMATQSSAFGHPSQSSVKPVSGADRRNEPRFGAEGEVTVVVFEDGHERELLAKLLDFSLHGLRVQMSAEYAEGTEVHVFFSWGEVTTQVMWCTPADNGFEIGLQLF